MKPILLLLTLSTYEKNISDGKSRPLAAGSDRNRVPGGGLRVVRNALELRPQRVDRGLRGPDRKEAGRRRIRRRAGRAGENLCGGERRLRRLVGGRRRHALGGSPGRHCGRPADGVPHSDPRRPAACRNGLLLHAAHGYADSGGDRRDAELQPHSPYTKVRQLA